MDPETEAIRQREISKLRQDLKFCDENIAHALELRAECEPDSRDWKAFNRSAQRHLRSRKKAEALIKKLEGST